MEEHVWVGSVARYGLELAPNMQAFCVHSQFSTTTSNIDVECGNYLPVTLRKLRTKPYDEG